MVRKKKYYSPLYTISIVTLAVFYLFTYSFNKGINQTVFPKLFLSVSIFSLSFLLIFFNHHRFKINKNKYLKIFVFMIVGFLLGSIGVLHYFTIISPIRTLSPESKIEYIYGTLNSDPHSWGPDWYKIDVFLQQVQNSSSGLFSAKGNCLVLLSSEQVKAALPGGISPKNGKRVYLSKGLPIRVFGSFSKDDSSLFIGKTISEYEYVSSPRFFSSTRASLRLSLIKLLYDWKKPGAFLLALLSGNRDYIDPELSVAFRRAGLSHILALSGMHLSLMGIVAIKTGKKIGGKKLGIKLSLIAMCFFVWFAGSSPSLNRALIMSVIALFLQVLGIPSSVLPVLAATTIIQTVFFPMDVMSLAFILSCSALWGIIVFGESLLQFYTKKLPVKIFSGLSSSVGAQLMTAPVVSFTFKILCPIGIIASWCISPLASFFLVYGMICVLISIVIPQLNGLCSFSLDFLYRSIEIPALFFAQVPPLSFNTLISTIYAAFIPLFAGIAIMIFSMRSTKQRTPDDSFARL